MKIKNEKNLVHAWLSAQNRNSIDGAFDDCFCIIYLSHSPQLMRVRKSNKLVSV
jgi:hypothetical protein